MRQATYAKCARTPSSATTATQKITRARMGWLVSSDARADISFRHQSTSHCSRWDRSPHWYSDRANTSRTARRTDSGRTPWTPTRSDIGTSAPAAGVEARAQRFEHHDLGRDAVPARHERREPGRADEERKRDGRAECAGLGEHRDGDRRDEPEHEDDESDDDRLAQPDHKQGPNLLRAECQGLREARLAAEIEVGDDADHTRREQQAREVLQDGREEQDSGVLLGPGELHIDRQHDG